MEFALKAFKNPSRRELLRTHSYLQRKWEQATRKKIKQVFRKEKAVLQEQIRSGQTIPFLEVKPWQDLLLAIYSGVGEEFGRVASRGLHGVAKQADTWMDKVLTYIRTYGAKKVTMITETTRDDLRDLFSQGMQEGWGNEELSGAIAEYYDRIGDWRSLLIARTETHAAANLGTNSFAQEAGMETHLWMAAMDELTREWHAEANGQTVPINEPFEVAGEQLMFPGDDSLGASGMNLCNCRCVETYG